MRPGDHDRDAPRPGGSAEFAIRFPLFALKRDGQYAGYHLPHPETGRTGAGVLVFTTEANVVRYLSRTGTQAQVCEFDRVAVFRKFLRSLPDPDTLILFDVLPDGQGNLHTHRVYPAGVVLERFLPDPGWGWGYPLYALRHRDGIGWACIMGAVTGGEVKKLLVVFTDEDLADRAVAAASQPLVAEPIPGAKEFARFIRGQADVAWVAFDPPDPRRGGALVRWVYLRDTLLANLAIEI
jgi:hypothetical protein